MNKNINSLPIPTPGTRFLERKYQNGRLIRQRFISFIGLDADHYLRFSVPGNEREHLNVAPQSWLSETEWEVNPGVMLKTTYTEMKAKQHTTENASAAA